MPALLHVTLYSFCLGVSCIHVAFAAWSAEHGRQQWDRMTKSGKQYSLILLEDDAEYRQAYQFAIFRAVVAAVSAVYFGAHLVVRRVRPGSWFVFALTDFVVLLALAALTVAAQFSTRYFASGQAVLDILAFFVLAIFYLVLLVALVVVFVRGARREGAKRALLSSVDRLKHVRRHGAPDPPTHPVAGQPHMAQMPEIRVTEA